MAHLHDLPLDLLDLIIVLLAISTDGARDLTRFAATCKQIKIMAERLHIQSIVNLHQLTFTDDYTKHHHPHDLLCECAAAGNREAMSILAMAILSGDSWFKHMLEDRNKRSRELKMSVYGLMHSHTLVRSFIRYGYCTDILKMRRHLLNYVASCAGYRAACAFGILTAVNKMCSEMVHKINAYRLSVREYDSFGNNLSLEILNKDLGDDRKKVLVIFDKVFPSKPI
nr:uncharacterized protein LOC122583009 isoform X2 [Erigeron canadensis]XP_043611379.1 uncharacterized protein LOC122583009 isoform X2 [Erigeron canadensis]XP_043611380.1 uncharacterized protein LOC122583009 isoform X2 [Erigeron canadensis]